MVRTTAKAQNAALRHSRINLFGSAKDLHKLQALQGEKNQGFGCLYNNMKHGQTSTKELGEFFKERSLIEDTYHKSVSKLAKSTSNCSQLGTFAPFWTVLKAATDKLAASHQKLVQKLQDIVKDIQKYGDEQHKKHKTVKIEVQGTADTVTNIQRTTDLVATAKELYNTRCIEFEKLKREGITGKELEKAETKYKKTLEEYKNLIDKYGNLREDFQKKMTDTCQKFEALEEAHLQQLKDFIKQYNIAIKDCHNSVQKVQREFTEQCEELTEVKLISMFSESKGTGKERPVLLEFEECDVSNIPMPDPETTKKKKKVKKAKKKKDKDGESPGNSPDMQQSSNSSDRSGSIGNASLGSFKDCVSVKATNNSKTTSTTTVATTTTTANNTTTTPTSPTTSTSTPTTLAPPTTTPTTTSPGQPSQAPSSSPSVYSMGSFRDLSVSTPQVDEEGFSIKPEDNRVEHQQPHHHHFYSDSDKSDSDSESEDRTRRIRVEIKPRDANLPKTTATVDEIKKSLGGLTLSPAQKRREKTNGDLQSRRQTALNRSSNQSNSAGNLLDLDLDFSSPPRNHTSNATTPDSALSPDLFSSSFGGDSFASPSPQTPVASSAGEATARPHSACIFRYSREYVRRPRSHTSNLLQSPTTLSDSLPPALPAKQRHSVGSTFAAAAAAAGSQIPNIPARPPSRPRSSGMQSPTHSSGDNPGLPRQDSNSSLSGLSPFNTHGVVGGSRGPSPLTLGMNDTIPIAAAFTESVNAYFKGNEQSKCMVKITGDLMLSFPAGIIQALTCNPQPAMLAFKVKNTHRLDVLPNKQLISVDATQTTSESTAYIFNMSNLVTLLRRQVEKNAAASYFNVDILKYQVKADSEGKSTPLHLCSYWKCDSTTTDLRVDYAYNAGSMDKAKSLTNVSLIVPVDGGVTVMHSKPAATWSSESKRVLWKIGEIPPGGEPGSLRAKFELAEGPSKPATLAVQFSGEGATLSGVDIELLNTFYRLSLVKKRFGTGKYLSES
ncbi:F-BAR domain only protein 2 isoform X4 [Strongylocentrotus purpuratus]|uniref:F-BAR domain only protein 2 n=1 Tax=Strongylocentrotus purpuratus TaxID=7668 RepID=A0A7M7T414_STRPU|nr:F-BAR domain only protein 2 isoform X4 [Strongylocentrotus purpuratus]